MSQCRECGYHSDNPGPMHAPWCSDSKDFLRPKPDQSLKDDLKELWGLCHYLPSARRVELPPFPPGRDTLLHTRVYTIIDRLRSRLSALEQELEGYRKRMPSGHETPDEERNETWLVASLREAQAEAATFPAWTREIPAAVDRQYRPWAVPPQTSALPCPSEYLSAQTGFNGEEGG